MNKCVAFSTDGKREFTYAVEAVRTIIGMTVQAYGEENAVIAARVEPLEETVDLMEETLKNKHIERLQNGTCSTKSSISFVEVLTAMDRIASHCANIAVAFVPAVWSSDGSFGRTCPSAAFPRRCAGMNIRALMPLL